MSQPLVSVVIPNYNYGRFLSEALDSVLTQTHLNIEIIVVDDGSTDNSLDILAAYEEKGIKVIRQKNSGVGAARNIGAAKSKGQFIAFLDADDIWMPTKIERQLTTFTDEIGLVTCGMREFDSASNETLAYLISDKTDWTVREILLLNYPVVSGSAIVVRRSAFETSGGFDDRKEMHPSEDWEFFYRLARIAKVVFLPEILVSYRNHGKNGHLNIPRYEHSMLIAYDKIFQNSDELTSKLRRKCYGNLYRMLAGSYLHAGQYGEFLKKTGKSLIFTPENLSYFASFPIRRLSKDVNKNK
jgi:glycosyltransferase involved in cell wall biosynthesis